MYSWVPNKCPGMRIYFQKNGSLYGPYLALYVYFYILARQFLRKPTNSPNLVVNKSCWYNWSLGRLSTGRWSIGMLLVDTSSRHWLRLCLKPLCIQFVKFATLYSYLALGPILLLNLCNLPTYTLICHYMFIRHTRVEKLSNLPYIYNVSKIAPLVRCLHCL